MGDERLGRLPGVGRARRARPCAVAGAGPALRHHRRDGRRAARRSARRDRGADHDRARGASKTLATAERVWRDARRRGRHAAATTSSRVGGGVVGDLAGFCAATYQRGIPVVQVPTTLVAQVDSAYGGKTGVDLPEAKNYVGAYHQPAGVLVDPDAARHAAGGRARGRLRRGRQDRADRGRPAVGARRRGRRPSTTRSSSRARGPSSRVVAADERDGGRRQVLNLGHTVGHAIETVTGYARYRHGEAVGLGLLAALRLSGQDALRDLVAELLAAAGLPTALEGVDPADVVAATARDKKRTSRRRSVRPRPRPGRRAPRHAGRRGRSCRRRARVARPDERPQPHRGHARRQPRPARAPRSGRLRRPHLRPPRAGDRGLRPRARADDALLPDQRRGRVRRAPAPPRGPRRRDRAQPGRVDALLVGDPRRARDRRAAGRRGAPVRRRRARGVPPRLGRPRPLRGDRQRARARRATATRWPVSRRSCA